MEKINKLEEDVKLPLNELMSWRIYFLITHQNEINNKTTFDKPNQMNIEKNRNNSNNSSKSCNMLERKRKRSHN